MRYLALFILLVGCGAQEPVTISRRSPVVRVNNDLVKEYVEAFHQRCVEQNHRVCLDRWNKLEYVLFVPANVIQDTPDAHDRVGVCYLWEDEKRRLHKTQVQLLEGDWDPKELEGLVYHELGHCVLGLDHQDGTVAHPTMMNPYLYTTDVYRIYWEQMVDEIFNATLSLLSWPTADVDTILTRKTFE